MIKDFRQSDLCGTFAVGRAAEGVVLCHSQDRTGCSLLKKKKEKAKQREAEHWVK